METRLGDAAWSEMTRVFEVNAPSSTGKLILAEACRARNAEAELERAKSAMGSENAALVDRIDRLEQQNDQLRARLDLAERNFHALKVKHGYEKSQVTLRDDHVHAEPSPGYHVVKVGERRLCPTISTPCTLVHEGDGMVRFSSTSIGKGWAKLEEWLSWPLVE